jgi:ribulose-phosphate 3-epimerase
MTMSIALSPSILQIEDMVADSPEIIYKVAEAIKSGGADYLHLDVMDQGTVQNSRFETPKKAGIVINACSKAGLALDVHLMVQDVSRFAVMYKGADIITFHPEYAGYKNTMHLMSRIRGDGSLVGIAMNPDVSVSDAIDPQYLSMADLLLFMTVQAGLGGQSFYTHGPKVLDVIYRCPTYAAQFQVDGGLKPDKDMLGECIDAGANNFVIGSGITRRCHEYFCDGILKAGIEALEEDTLLARNSLMEAYGNSKPKIL